MTNASVLMFESDPSTGLDQHRRENELWLAMQAAHDQWMNATEVLHDLTIDAPGDFPSTDETLRNAKAVEEQRSAFEEYIEARLAFSEFVYDRNSGMGPSAGADSKQPFHEMAPGSWSVRTTPKLALLALAVVPLCPVVFGLAYLAHERKHVQELSAARDAMSAMLNQARRQTPTRKLDAGNPPQQVAIQQEDETPGALGRLHSTPAQGTTAPAPADGGHWRSVETPHPQQPKQTTPRAQRHKYEFTLTLSPRYARVGPVKVSLHNLDRKNNYFDLSIMLGDFRLDKKHVRPYEPVWINVGGSSTPIRLLADRIGKNEVHGYLSSPEQKPAAGPSRRATNAGSSTRVRALAASPASRQQNGG
jgi:hypothetical protein